MKVFISWSGESSQIFAKYLNEFLRNTLQDCDTWISSKDMPPGDRWRNEVSKILAECNFGIFCLTPDNLDSAWLNFEAGAISKSVDNAHIIPYLLNVETDEFRELPLNQFQSVEANKEGTNQLLGQVNKTLNDPLSKKDLEKRFNDNWQNFKSKIEQLRVGSLSSFSRLVDHFQYLALSADSVTEEDARNIATVALSGVCRDLSAKWAELHVYTTNVQAQVNKPANMVRRLIRIAGEPEDFLKKDPIKMGTEYDIDKRNPGLWTWVVENKEPVWVHSEKEPLVAAAKRKSLDNLAGVGQIDCNRFNPNVYTIIAFPLCHNVQVTSQARQELWGLFNVEWYMTDNISQDEFENLRKMAKAFMALIRKWDETNQSHKETQSTIEDFKKMYDRSMLKRDIK